MEVDLARTMLAVAEHRSFSAAGQELSVVQSAVTTRIRTLERLVGSRLFDRSPQQVRLTDQGERLLDHARALVDAEERLLAAARPDDEITGRVRIAAAESMCTYRLPELVVHLMRAHPGLEVEFFAAEGDEAVGHLLARRCELAVVLDPGDLDARVGLSEIGMEPVLLVSGADGPTPTCLEDLAHTPLFLLQRGCSYSDALLLTLTSQGVTPPRVTRFSSLEAVKACVGAGLGVGLLPRASLRAADRVRPLPVPVAPTRVALARERSRYAGASVERVARAVAESWGGADPSRADGEGVRLPPERHTRSGVGETPSRR